MSRPSGSGTFQNRVAIHRPVEATDEYSDVVRSFAPAAGPHWMAINREKGGLRDSGAGEERVAAARGECWAQVDVRERDVLVVLRGPEAGTVWKVVATHNPGRGRRTLTLDAYSGTPP